ncbi:MAG: RecX family transcriptional regulator [Candidatus Symbiothrix sp.]|jgi:regulatory protein|nr:RecX family transcriptional regulator [Candidatus Symbiothrix sp.]
MKPMTCEQALRRLMAWCSRAERCACDLRRKMNGWEIPEGEQEEIIRRLQEEKFLDERRYCRAFVNDKSRYNHWGAQKIEYELKKKHLPGFLIREALEERSPEENREELRRLLENKRKTLKGETEFEIKWKLMRFAAGRGFSLDEIEKALHTAHN